MAQIRKDKERETPALSTSSLPDIIFMFLFFFMAITTMKEVTFKVRVASPLATEVQKLENKSLTRYVYIGKPMEEYQRAFGSETRIQLGDAFADVTELEEFIVLERSAMSENDQNLMTVSIKADKDTKMGIINDVKQSLRRAYALKIVYAASKRTSY
ncbi:MAG: biopolymer transporter ExbD [Paludibacter sp.]|jgi:biopolymer transport protein ExbD|nr:biopolymer transporter ExbD [Paludibacter sp.]MDD3489964.1 biopolymer transporter ExbD [Paludibacter sp.]